MYLCIDSREVMVHMDVRHNIIIKKNVIYIRIYMQ